MIIIYLFFIFGISNKIPTNSKCSKNFITQETEKKIPIARIVGGSNIKPNSWPWFVKIIADNQLCGGTILSSEWIITAGHCCLDELNVTDYEFYTGDHSQTEWDSTQRNYKIIQIHRHPQYIPIKYDLCLLKTEPILLDATADIICLPQSNQPVEVVSLLLYNVVLYCRVLTLRNVTLLVLDIQNIQVNPILIYFQMLFSQLKEIIYNNSTVFYSRL